MDRQKEELTLIRNQGPKSFGMTLVILMKKKCLALSKTIHLPARAGRQNLANEGHSPYVCRYR